MSKPQSQDGQDPTEGEDKRLKTRVEELEDENGKLVSLLATASHDIRGPLRKIVQHVELMEEDYAQSIDQATRYYFDVIVGSATRVSKLIDHINHHMTIHRHEVALSRIALSEPILEKIDDLTKDNRWSAARVLVDDLPMVEADPFLVGAIFEQLIKNGLIFQKKGNIPALKIQSQLKDSRMMISVTDNGIGITTDNPDRIFEAFVRLHKEAVYPGAGLGLANCQEACRKLGWSLDHVPNPEGGTIMRVQIPLDHVRR